MLNRMLSIGLGLAMLAGFSGTSGGSSTHNATVAGETSFATTAFQLGGTYTYRTEADALAAKQHFLDQGKIVLGPYDIQGHWQIVVSD